MQDLLLLDSVPVRRKEALDPFSLSDPAWSSHTNTRMANRQGTTISTYNRNSLLFIGFAAKEIVSLLESLLSALCTSLD